MELTPKQLKNAQRLAKIIGNGNLGVFEHLLEIEDKIDTVIPTVEAKIEKALDEVKSANPNLNAILEQVKGKDGKDGIDGAEGVPGMDGKDYVLTDEDKQVIAQSVIIPAVEVKVIEKTEVIKEQPIVTEIVKEVAFKDTAAETRDKLESLKDDDRLDKSAIKGLEKGLNLDQSVIDRAISILDQRTQYLINKLSNVANAGTGGGGSISSVSNANGTLTISPTTGAVIASLNLSHANTWLALQTFSLSTISITGGSNNQVLTTNGSGTLSWTTPSGGGTPAGSNTQIQYNNSGAFGASSNFTWTNTAKTLTLDSLGYGLRIGGSSLDLLQLSDGGTGAGTYTTIPRFSAGGDFPTSGTYGSILYAGTTYRLAQDYSNLFYNDTNKLFGVQTTHDPLAAGHFISDTAITFGVITGEVSSTQAASLATAPSGDSISQVAPLTVGTYGGSASPNYGSGSYTANGSAYDYVAYNIFTSGGTDYYQNIQTSVGNFTDDNSSNPFTVSYSWSASPTGGGYTKTILGRQINGGGYQYYDAGSIGPSGSISDDGSLSPYNWGSATFPSGYTASPDFTANNTTYTADVFNIATSPSGHTYYVQGDQPTVTDNNSGYPIGISLNNANGFQVKFHGIAGTSIYKIIGANSSFTQRTDSSSDSATISPNTYGYAPDGGATPQYYRIIGYKTLGPVTIYSTPSGWATNNADTTVDWYSAVAWSALSGAAGYKVQYSTDGVTATKNIDVGNITSMADDTMTAWTGSAGTITPTSYTPPAAIFDRPTGIGITDPTAIIKSASGFPVLQFQSSGGSVLGNLGMNGSNPFGLFQANAAGAAIYLSNNDVFLAPDIGSSSSKVRIYGSNTYFDWIGDLYTGGSASPAHNGHIIMGGSTSGTVGLLAASTITSWNLTLPTSAGSANQILQTNGSGVTSWAYPNTFAYVAKTANYTLTADDYLVNCTANSFTATLPTAVSKTGQVFIVKNSGAGTITVATTSSQTIDGSTTYSVAAGAWVTVMSNGANFIIIG